MKLNLFYTNFSVVLFFLCCSSINGQNVILDPNGDGGFENGTSFAANGWTVLNGTEPNYWMLSNAPSGTTGNRCAHITDDGSTYQYDITGGTDVHFYRSIDRTPYTGTIMLEFDWKGVGESGYDALTVGFTGAGGCCNDGSGIYNPKTIIFDQIGGQSTWKTESVDITGVSTGHDKLDFYWEGGTTSGVQPPHAIDNVYMYEVVAAPVEMEYFIGELEGPNPKLVWKTENEEKFSHFDIQRSTDNIRYTTIGKVYANEKKENSIYTFIDQNPYPDNYLYRLKQVDNDKSFEFSKTVSVNIEPVEESIVKFYPNPVVTKARLGWIAMESKMLDIAVFDIFGIKHLSYSYPVEKGTNWINLNLADLEKGFYHIRIGKEFFPFEKQ